MWKQLCIVDTYILGFRFSADSVHNPREMIGSNFKCGKFYSKLLAVVLAGHREFRVDFSLCIIYIISYYTAVIVILQLLTRTHYFCLYLLNFCLIYFLFTRFFFFFPLERSPQKGKKYPPAIFQTSFYFQTHWWKPHAFWWKQIQIQALNQ